MTPDVLVVGAGPTGLATALSIVDHGGTVRVVERRPERFRPSRAMIVHARTLEMLRPFGVVEDVLARSDTAPTAELHIGGRTVSAGLAELALPDTAYPHLTLVRQMDVEEVLGDALAQRGVVVERGTALVDVTGSDSSARVGLEHPSGSTRVECKHVVGCDGQSSTVRASAGIGWRGGPYREEVVLADLELDDGPTPGVLHAAAAAEGLVFLFALGEQATWRLLATRPAEGPGATYGQPAEPVDDADLQHILDGSGLDGRLRSVTWSARIPLQHRLADRFRTGRVFLAGDAAHAHSPAAGQGMNTGIQDGLNLGWKLAFAARASPPDAALLDSYEQERRTVARWVLGMTHAVFFAEASGNPLARLLRERLVPLGAPLVPVLLGRRLLMAEGVRVLSGLRIRHRHSPITLGGPSDQGVHAGDRLPDMTVASQGRSRRLHEITAQPGVHLLLSPGARVDDDALRGQHVHVTRVDRRGRGVVAVRPDGFVGCVSGDADEGEVRGWLDLVSAR